MCVLALAAAALVLAPPAGAGIDWAANVADARQYARSRAGAESFALMDTQGRLRGRLAERPRTSASVIKAMFLVAYLRQPSVRARDLTTYERGLLGPMIRASKNRPATTVFRLLGPAPVEALARAAGMTGFRLDAHWGSPT